jgi:hypothetical protein
MRGRWLVVLLMLLFVGGSTVWGQGEVEPLVEEAFRAVARAEAAGGDVGLLVDAVNAALGYLEAGDVAGAELLLRRVIVDAGEVEAAGVRQGNVDAAVAGVKAVFLLGLAGGVWVYGERVFWGLWLRLKRGWVVERA